MNPKILLLVILPIHMTGLTSEPMVPPHAEWQLSAGGHGNDSLTAFRQTTDGGFILAGWSESPPSGNKTSPYFGGVACDLWLVRLDSTGTILWDRTFGGDAQDGTACAVRQTRDGGFVLASMSRSGVSGTKTSPQIAGRDYFDLWVIRLDANGNKQWEAAFGGANNEFFASIEETLDGGFILGGSSDSGVSGNKSSPNRSNLNAGSPNQGLLDYWLVRLDANGGKLWDRSFGGANDDTLNAVQLTPDGGFILGGESTSPAGGNKTSPGYPESSQQRPVDFWVVRVDQDGNKVWDKSYGGTSWDRLYALTVTTDGGFLFGGYSYSDANGNKSSARFGIIDYWVVRTDSAGEKLWDKTYGGGGLNVLRALSPTFDGGFILTGYSDDAYAEGRVGNKTSPNFGQGDYWTVRIDELGNMLWDVSLGGTRGDVAYDVRQTVDGGFLVGGESSSGTNGNKTSPGFGMTDFWIVKLLPEDSDADGVADLHDLCPDTAPGAVVDAAGCSLEQLCPCDSSWKNHGEYVSCVAETVGYFVSVGLVTETQRKVILRQAGQADCGK